MSFVELFTKLFQSPSDLFKWTRENPTWGVLFVVLMGCGALVNGYAMSKVDLSEAQEQMKSAEFTDQPEFAELSEAERQQAEQVMGSVADSMPMITVFTAAIVYDIGLALTLVLLALFLWLVAKQSTPEPEYVNWFSLAVWSSAPLLLGHLALLIATLFTGERPEQPLAFLTWLPNDWTTWSGASVLQGIDIPLVLMIVLMSIGYRVYTGWSQVASACVVLIPFVLFYGARLLTSTYF